MDMPPDPAYHRPMTIHTQLRALLYALPFLLYSILAQADPWYHVEILVFEHLDTLTDEQWPEIDDKTGPDLLIPGKATSLIKPDAPYTLNQVAKRLARSAHYKVLYHQAWQQPILKKRHAKAVKIINKDQSVSGSLRLYKATYLYAKADLWLMNSQQNLRHDTQMQNTREDWGALRFPHLKQVHRIKIKRLYYFDHPRFGVLLQLTPIKMPKTVAATTTQ